MRINDMNDSIVISRNALAGFLLFSALVLACILIAHHTLAPTPAQALGNSSRAGFFAVATATVDEDLDLLWVAHVDAQRLLVFSTDKTGRISLVGNLDLSQVFQSARPTQRAPRPGD